MANRISLRGGAEESTGGNSGDNALNLPGDSHAEMSLFELARLLVRRRTMIVGATLAVMTLTAVVVLLTPNQYRSKASILPSGQVDRMAELKSLAGLTNGAAADENSSQLFPAIFQSRTVARAVLEKTYSFEHDGDTRSMTLQEYFGTDDPDGLYGKLAQITVMSVDKKSGVIGLSVETRYPGLSQAVASEYLTQLESYNMHQRRSQAKERETYLARELSRTKQELEAAEDSLAGFQRYNRNWVSTSDPTLIKLVSRLQREVEVKTKTFAYLTQEYEVARLDVQKDLPIVRVLDNPTLPTEKSSPRRKLSVFLAGLASLVIASLGAVAVEMLRRDADRRGAADYRLLREDLTKAFPRMNRMAVRLRKRETVGADE
jgi:uncharacterized protein involved in exopolysaccharide biosynthesis